MESAALDTSAADAARKYYARVRGPVWDASPEVPSAGLVALEQAYADALRGQLGNHDLRPLFDVRIAYSAQREGNYDLALERLDAFDARVPEPDSEPGIFNFCAAKGRCRARYVRIRTWLDLGLVDLARSELQRLDDAYHSLGSPQGSDLHELCMARFDVALAEADFVGAEELADDGLARFPLEETGDAREDAELIARREDLLVRRVSVREKRALTEPDIARAVREELLQVDLDALDAESAAEVRFRAFSVASVLGDDALRQRLVDGYPKEMPGTLERALGAAMAVSLDAAEDNVHDALRAEVESLFTSWRTQPPRLSGTGRFFTDKARFAVRVAAERAPDAEAGLDVVLAALSLNDLGRSLGLDPLRSADLIAALDGPGDATLVVWPGDIAGVLFLVTADGVERHPFAGSESLRAPVAALSGLLYPHSLDDPGWEERWAQSAALLQEGLLPTEVADRISSLVRLTVLGTELIWNAPIGLLRPNGEPLAVSVQVRELTDPRIGLARSLGVLPADGVRFTAGVPRPGWVDPLGAHGEAPRFPDGAVERTGALLGGSEPDAFDEQRVLDGALDGASAWAFLGHADHLSGRERSSALVLGGAPSAEAGDPSDGRLDCDEVERIVSPPLVFLAACSTGAGPKRMGSGAVANLAGAFTRAGARCVVASRVDLLVGSTALFVERFGASFADGATVGQAVLEARRAVRATPGFEHPAHWMGLDVHGDDSLRLDAASMAASGSSATSGPPALWFIGGAG
ncbi:MAG: CHAT domain-containing protein, partial [Planctomycetota bacterium]